MATFPGKPKYEEQYYAGEALEHLLFSCRSRKLLSWCRSADACAVRNNSRNETVVWKCTHPPNGSSCEVAITRTNGGGGTRSSLGYNSEFVAEHELLTSSATTLHSHINTQTQTHTYIHTYTRTHTYICVCEYVFVCVYCSYYLWITLMLFYLSSFKVQIFSL